MKHTILLALGLGFALALPLHAGNKVKANGQPKPELTPEQIFKKKDKSGDGLLSKSEFIGHAKDPAKAEARFAKLDTDGDGKLTLAEFTAKSGKGGKCGKKNK